LRPVGFDAKVGRTVLGEPFRMRDAGIRIGRDASPHPSEIVRANRPQSAVFGKFNS